MRIFVGLHIEDRIREHIQIFVDGARGFAPDARWVRAESLHVTLKFVGEKDSTEVDRIKDHLRQLKFQPFDISFRGSGFFPMPKSARVFWIGVESGPELGALAREVDEAVSRTGVPREDRPFSPHLTLARAGHSGSPRRQKSDRPNSVFKRVQEKLAAMSPPDFGTMTAREFYLYESKLSPGGTRYTPLERYGVIRSDIDTDPPKIIAG